MCSVVTISPRDGRTGMPFLIRGGRTEVTGLNSSPENLGQHFASRLSLLCREFFGREKHVVINV
jgi:hypothetical protein